MGASKIMKTDFEKYAEVYRLYLTQYLTTCWYTAIITLLTAGIMAFSFEIGYWPLGILCVIATAGWLMFTIAGFIIYHQKKQEALEYFKDRLRKLEKLVEGQNSQVNDE